MPSRMLRRCAMTVALASAALADATLLQAETADDAEAFATADGLVAELYDEVTFAAGAGPDWERVRSMFLDQATVVLRTSREETTIFSVDGFVDDFVAFIERAKVDKTGFAETIVRTDSTIFGDIAHILVLYQVSVPGSERPPRQGVDSFQLIRKEGRWWIVSVTNELPTPERAVPSAFRD